MDNNIDIYKIRRFALTFGIILLTYSLAGIELVTPTEIQPFGIPLLIQSPDFILFGILLSTIYGTLRFIYFQVICDAGTPRKARKNLKNGKLADGSLSAQSTGEYIDKAIIDINRYFPTVKNEITNNITTSPLIRDITQFRLSNFEITNKMKLFGYIRDIDYYSPIWFNSTVVLILLIKVIYYGF